jgi:hypothetical protein
MDEIPNKVKNNTGITAEVNLLQDGKSYTKTGKNTATFSCSCPQYLPTPTGYRLFTYAGTLTYSSEHVCVYECDQNGPAGTTKKKYTFRVYPNGV